MDEASHEQATRRSGGSGWATAGVCEVVEGAYPQKYPITPIISVVCGYVSWGTVSPTPPRTTKEARKGLFFRGSTVLCKLFILLSFTQSTVVQYRTSVQSLLF